MFRRAFVILSFAGLIGLSACSTPTQFASDVVLRPTSDVAADAAPRGPVPGYDWGLHQDGAEASLAYGVAETDDVSIQFDCQVGSGQVRISRDIPQEATPVIYLESGGDTESWSADESVESTLTGGRYITVEANANTPVLLRFRRLGWLAAWLDGQREVYVPHPGSETKVEAFFAACG